MKKNFEKPELTIILFAEDDDIITTSGLMGQRFGAVGDEWEDPADI